ncbi:MAG TPA: hypothetical protein VK702_11705 [Candidatus Acidoferrum sp.]|jgi:hypothetical protein|nr:hypothetical protein [Candidatus Acidoferrum sp.]
MNSARSRLVLGLAAVALFAGLCFAAIWSDRGRLPARPASVSVALPADGALRAENLRLRAEVARLTAERHAALAKPASALEPRAISANPVPEPRVTQRRQPAKPSSTASGEFAEPQTFGSASTAN